MSRLPLLLTSSVIRGSQLGESHGGLYVVDLERGTCDLKLDWNRTDIDVAGRGGDRGLRGITFYGDNILVAANSQLLMLDRDFVVIEAFTNPYLRHCHEISVAGSRVFLTATGFDSVLMFDLATKHFTKGWNLSSRADALDLRAFDPGTLDGPVPSHRFHLNSVQASATGFYLSGLYTPGLLHADSNGLSLVAKLPEGTHNAQMLGSGVLYNDTVGERICYRGGDRSAGIAVPDFAADRIINAQRFGSQVARARFARGLCVLTDTLVAGGSSPSTIAVYDLNEGKRLQHLNLSMDIRNAVHGLAVWPYS